MYQIEKINNTYVDIKNITRDELDLDKTLDCGQAFRWHKDKDGYWVGVIKNKLCVLKQYDNYISTNLNEEDIDLVIYYFNIDMNYTNEISKLNLDEFAEKAYKYGRGIHILRQDYFETMVTFLMSSCNTMRNIRNIVNKLSELYGTKLEEKYNDKVFIGYTFPTLDVISKLTMNELEACRMGFRAKYLVDMCRRLNMDNSILLELHAGVNGGMTRYVSAINTLKEFKGIGEKVANCISLFAGHHLCAFPIDTHMQQLIDKEYKGKIDLNRYGNISGIIQQYMYYYKAFN